MKIKINIFSDKKTELFFTELLSDYELSFMKLKNIYKNFENTNINIIFINDVESEKLINLEKLNENFLLLTNIKKERLNVNNKLIETPISINQIKNRIENFVENLKIRFYDITIVNEKLTNTKNDSFCFLTKLESEILTHLIIEKQSTKKYILENILNIKNSVQTNSLESHLSRIRKKMNQINTSVKIQSKNEKLLILV